MTNHNPQAGGDKGQEKRKPWPFNGYAPGNYMNDCSICKKEMYNVDKLCFVCLECAIIGAQQILNAKPDSGAATCRWVKNVKDWHEKFGVHVGRQAGLIGMKRFDMRQNILQEEVNELKSAYEAGELHSVADAICDILYVIIGTAVEFGLHDKLDALFAEVHRSNMSKLDENGNPVKREDGKILKSKLFSPPDLKAILENQLPPSKPQAGEDTSSEIINDIKDRFERFLIEGEINWWPNLLSALHKLEGNAYRVGTRLQDAYRDKLVAASPSNAKPVSDVWIDVKEPPEVGRYVLVNVGTDTILKGILKYNGWVAFFADGEKLVGDIRPVTHWQPLPAPPIH